MIRVTIFPLGALVLAVTLSACGVDPQPGRDDRLAQRNFDRQRAIVQQSPCDSVPEPRPLVPAALTGGSTYENEVHDCQRLVIASSATWSFGPLVGIFPIDSAMALPAGSFADGRIVATVYNWGDFAYQPQAYVPLGIDAGWHCLWLRGTSGRWEAGITQAVDRACVEPGHRTPAYNLEVQEFRHQSHGQHGVDPDTIYPATARWGWDSANHQHYMGIKCGDAWCAIGPDGFRPMESNPLTGPKERGVPGWYDAQHLAIYDSTASPALRPGPWGVLYPIEGLGSTTTTQFEAGMTVAHIVVDGTGRPGGLGNYRAKFNLDGTGSRGTAEIWVVLDPGGGGRSDFRSSQGRVRARFRRIPVLHAVKGAARWRWHDTDESAWYWCDDCCDSGALE